MESLKARLIVSAAVLVAVLGLSILAISVKNRGTAQDAAGSEAPPDTAAPDTASPRTRIHELTVDDGDGNQDVYLQSLDIQVEVTGNVASTRYTMIIKNRTRRVLESIVAFPLPNENVTITYYALDVDGKMREAVPVEKARGTQVFEEIKNRRKVVDPGLLEWVEGNKLRTRVYPVFANDTRTVSIVCEEELARENDSLYYRLPIAYTGPLEKFTLSAAVLNGDQKPRVLEFEDGVQFKADGENYAASFERKNYRPSRALVFALPPALADIPQVMTQPVGGSYAFLVSVTPEIEPREKRWADDLAIIWDASLSGKSRDLRRDMEMLDIIFTEKKNAGVRLYFLNNKFVKNGDYNVADGNWDKLKNVLETAVFDGGTDFSQINLNNIAGNEILFFSDGISTLSDANFLNGDKADRPIHCIVSSAKADYNVMKSIAVKTKGKFINANALSSEKIKDELLNEPLTFFGVEHGSAVREVYPTIAAPVQGNFSVAGISDTNDAELTLLFGFGNKVEKRIKVPLDAQNAASRRSVAKIWAQKKTAELYLGYEKNYDEIAELGRQAGIVTRNSSLIVLETIGDYIRYGIEPPVTEPGLQFEYWLITGKADTTKTRAGVRNFAGNGGGATRDNDVVNNNIFNNSADRNFFRQRGDDGPQERVARIMPEPVRADFAPDNNVWDQKRLKPTNNRAGSTMGGGDPRARTTQMGILGIVSGQIKGERMASADLYGMGGFATDIDAILYGVKSNLAKRKAAPPYFLKGASLYSSYRSRASIQLVVMRNMAALRDAYNRRAREIPDLAGTVTVKFRINAFGEVTFAYAMESTINDTAFKNTVVTQVESWTFESIDKPGDLTDVLYPFVFKKEDEAEAARERERAIEEAAQRVAQERRYVPQSKYGVSLDGAVFAAMNLKKWRDIDFPSEKPKYPAPKENDSASNLFSEKTFKGVSDIFGVPARNPVYMSGLTGKTTDDYQTYLKLRDGYADAPEYYFDMADWFYTHGDRETALRVLTSVADLELESAPLYRLLEYRFKEYGEYALEKFVCGKVVQWRPLEPQSHRDYALALAGNGEKQAALDSLCAMLTKPYSRDRLWSSGGIEEVVVTEINHLIAKNPGLNTSKVDKRLIVEASVDVRVVINWNMDNADADLHVLDPNGEECDYEYNQTHTGGRISADIKRGGGPEQFILKRALKGKYAVYVSYYGNNQNTSTVPPIVMAEIYTKYAGRAEQRKIVSLRMPDANRGDGKPHKALAAEFEF